MKYCMAKKIVKKRKLTKKQEEVVKDTLTTNPRVRATVDAIKKVIASGKRPNISAIMRDTGWSPQQSKKLYIKKTQLYKDEVPQFILDILDEREAAIKDLEKKRPKAKYRDLVDGVHKLTNVARLEAGLATERIAVNLTDEEKEDLDNLL